MRQSPQEMKLTKSVLPVVEDLGFRFIALSFAKDILQILAENTQTGSLGVEDCAKISRAVAPVLEVEDLISGAYRLEVSSPGIDRPLLNADDFRRFAGFEAKIELAAPNEAGQRRFRGILGEEKDDAITLETEQGNETFHLSDISKARLVLTDDLLKTNKSSPKAAAQK